MGAKKKKGGESGVKEQGPRLTKTTKASQGPVGGHPLEETRELEKKAKVANSWDSRSRAGGAKEMGSKHPPKQETRAQSKK